METEINLDEIDNIIFDLGNVIIRLDIEATTRAFQKIYDTNYESAMEKLEEEGVFNAYEKGEISTLSFFKQLQQQSEKEISKDILEDAWNAMLLDIPDDRYQLLLNAKGEFRTFCLSNTNETHIDWIYAMLKESKGIANLNDYFEKVYLSHEMGMRKPDVEIFDKVLQDNSLDPGRTLFIDDTAGHLEGAKKAGIKVLHLTSFRLLDRLFKNAF